MAYDFDRVIDRAGTNATKLQKYADSNILPFWIADMDFAVPDFILEPLRERLDHPIVGYTKKPDSLTLALQNWLAHHYGWQVPEEWIVWLPGVVPGLNMAVKMLAEHEQLLILANLLPVFRFAGQHRPHATCRAAGVEQRQVVNGLCPHGRRAHAACQDGVHC